MCKMAKERSEKSNQWLTPIVKQCFVTLGVVLNVAQLGLVMGFTSSFLPQLRAPGSPISIDDSTGSWIASTPGFSLFLSNLSLPIIMGRYGRKVANLASAIPALVGWLLIVSTYNVPVILIARLLQGLTIGMTNSLATVLVGEYTSPKKRGAFLATISLAIAVGTLATHTMGSYLSWQKSGLICVVVAFIDLVIIVYSPETPSWLIDNGRYEEGKKVFRWLRGDNEEEELQKMVETNMDAGVRKADNVSFVKRIGAQFVYLSSTIRKPEFYKPICIMIHLNILIQWNGALILVSYAVDIFKTVIGEDVNVDPIVISVDIQRIVTNLCAVFVIRKVKRKTMLMSTVGLNIAALLATAGYSYAKHANMLPFDHPAIGTLLIHFLAFVLSFGSIPLPLIISGEIFPLEYRSLATAISATMVAPSLFLVTKTLPFLMKTIGLHGAYCLYAGIVIYCLVMAWIFLPETKDRTLQDIEDEFKGRKRVEDIEVTQSLTS